MQQKNSTAQFDSSKIPTKVAKTLRGHEGYVNVAKFSSDFNYCVSGSSDRSVIIWNPYKGTLIKQYKGMHNKEVLDAYVTKDNSKISSVGGDKGVFYWDIITGKSIKRFSGHDARVNSVTMNKEETVIVSGSYDGSVKFWDLKQSKPVCLDTVRCFKDSVTDVIVSNFNIYASSVDGYVRHMDMRAGEITSDYIGEAIVGMDMTADKKSLIVNTLDSKIRLLNIGLGEELAVYEGHQNKNYMVNCKLSKDNSFFVTGSEDGVGYVYQFLSTVPVGRLYGHNDTVSSVDVSRKDGSVLTGSYDGTLRLWIRRGFEGAGSMGRGLY